MNLDTFNSMGRNDARGELIKCCSSLAWVENMEKARPYETLHDFLKKAEAVWFSLGERDWLEAFSGHPKIGDLKSLQKKYANTATWASGEQSSVSVASEETLKELANYNDLYEKKFGFIFIVCATGKSADEMLLLIKDRYNNNRETELKSAAEEQNKITKIRLEKL